jgi:hypothetical protein
MDFPISLEYSNGRIHEATYTTSDTLRPGSEFALHGRRWLVVGLTKERRASDNPPRLLCVTTAATAKHTLPVMAAAGPRDPNATR